MTNNLPPRVVRHRGLTLLELTIAITILLTLTALLFIGSRAWKRGSDRAACVLTLRNMQMATRSYQSLYGYSFGGRPSPEYGTQDIGNHLYRKGYIEEKLYNQATGTEKCPAGGAYACPMPDIFPQEGQLYIQCSLSGSDEHAPASSGNW